MLTGGVLEIATLPWTLALGGGTGPFSQWKCSLFHLEQEFLGSRD